ncbi:hypothetical protein KM472_gp235 [Cynomolgus macaque cytomegalovirus strain Ottawa]|uniref:Uncharacterized protein n=1 Tax=macacine betaherpesvirus 8 TaxID=2560567 RepID=G8H0W4_9BETA|nr:hypothetical protein KM472_gp235 [Cynomolgus macaque cytomegalovirus strain Ottawa]AEQ32312.1 hypothetical protein cy223 [Cynomolgus macaque cytomegalovirus strain Ottawa]
MDAAFRVAGQSVHGYGHPAGHHHGSMPFVHHEFLANPDTLPERHTAYLDDDRSHCPAFQPSQKDNLPPQRMARRCGLHRLEHMGVGDLEYVFGTHCPVAGLCVFPGAGT